MVVGGGASLFREYKVDPGSLDDTQELNPGPSNAGAESTTSREQAIPGKKNPFLSLNVGVLSAYILI